MAKKITKNINAKFNPTLLDGYNIYNYGGKKYFWNGGPMQPMQSIQPNVVGPETLQAMNTSQLDPMTVKTPGGVGLSTGLTQGISTVGQGMEEITNAYRPNKANYGTNIGGGALKGAAMGAAVGSIVPGVGTVVGGVAGGIGGALSGLTKSIAKSGQIKQQEEQMQQQQQDTTKQNLISNLPGQSSYVPTFEMGGNMNMMGGNKEILDRVSSVESNTTHEQSPYGGVPISNNALVEKDEYLYTNKAGKKYIFSNKLFRQ